MPAQSPTPPAPLQFPTLTDEDMKSPGTLNSHLQNLTQMVNYLLGHAGEIYLKSPINMGGNPIKNTGTPVGPNDVVSAIFAQKTYGAQALLPQFEALGKSVFQSYRRVNDTKQRENYSSFLKGVLNTAPTSNTAQVSATAVSGGSTTVTVTAGLHQFVDSSSSPFSSRSDTIAVPSAFAYTSATRTSNIVDVITPSPSGVVLGEALALGGAGDPTFNGGAFVVSKIVSSTEFQYQQIGPNGSTSGGGFTPINIYYYTIARGKTTLNLIQAVGSDSWSNRVAASIDGSTIVAVVAIDTNGMELNNSAAGATSPQQGGNIPVVRRI